VRVDDVVIVGAGPAGLAAAAALRARGIHATILERGEHVGEQWRTRYDRLHLHTIRWLSNLPGYRIPREFGRWVARDQFVQYLEQYTAHHRLEPRFGVEATRIDRDDGHWCVHTAAGMVPARVVVVASGYTRVPYLPRWPGAFDGPVVHSADYRNPRPYPGQDVLVIGAGNSGTEIAVDLAEGGARGVRIAVRTPPNIVRRDTKGFPISSGSASRSPGSCTRCARMPGTPPPAWLANLGNKSDGSGYAPRVKRGMSGSSPQTSSGRSCARLLARSGRLSAEPSSSRP
jgi:putative flavoprotein involved in K+ transport